MSARSISRARERELAREQRRLSRRAKRAGAGVAVALGTGIAMAPAADAATFTVNSNVDGPATACDATCTLRDAIDAANVDAAADTITFAPSVTGQIVLDTGEGELPLYSAMTIQGPGAANLAIDGDEGTRIFYADTSSVGAPYDPVNISGLTLRNAEDTSGDGGSALYAFQTATTLTSVAVRNNYADEDAAVYMQGGSLTVNDSTFAGNHSAGDGGAIYTDDDAGPATGGTSRLVIRNTTFVGNTADGSAGAIYIDDETDSALISSSTIVANSADDDAGAISVYGPETGVVRIEDSTITGNTAADVGGGIYNFNQYDKPLEIVDSTIVGNFAGTDGGGIYQEANDVAAYEGSDTLELSSTIVAENDAPRGPDLAQRLFEIGDDPVVGTMLAGFSLIGDTTDATITEDPAGSNLLNVSPELGSLSDNGGPTRTMLPALTSPVVDAGIANGLTVDQRGLPRTVKTKFDLPAGGDGTDIGAVELQDPGLTGATVKAKKKQKASGKKVVITVEAGADEEVNAVGSGSIKAGKAKAKLKQVTKTVAGGKLAKLKLTPKSKKDSKKILAALGDGKKGKAKLTVVVTDPAGNSETKKPKVTLKG